MKNWVGLSQHFTDQPIGRILYEILLSHESIQNVYSYIKNTWNRCHKQGLIL